jgi:hypothetical protein
MSLVHTDQQNAAIKVVTSINDIARVGGADSTVSGNATVTALIAAINALAPVAAAGPDANRQIGIGLRMGVNAGLLSETHGQTTIAGLVSAVNANLDVALQAAYSAGGLPE